MTRARALARAMDVAECLDMIAASEFVWWSEQRCTFIGARFNDGRLHLKSVPNALIHRLRTCQPPLVTGNNDHITLTEAGRRLVAARQKKHKEMKT